MYDQLAEIVQVPSIDIVYYFHRIVDFFVSYYPTLFSGAKSFFGLIVGICLILSGFFFIGIIYVVEGLKRTRKLEEKKYTKKVDEGFEEGIPPAGDPVLAKRWDRILVQIESSNESDWRQAIIEADIILEDLLVKLGYKGEGIGEKLKRANKGDFKTLDQAWEAHKIRNRIAHDGTGHPLNQIEAKEVIGLYRQVFEEFYHI